MFAIGDWGSAERPGPYLVHLGGLGAVHVGGRVDGLAEQEVEPPALRHPRQLMKAGEGKDGYLMSAHASLIDDLAFIGSQKNIV